jgi:hypothetical protein
MRKCHILYTTARHDLSRFLGAAETRLVACERGSPPCPIAGLTKTVAPPTWDRHIDPTPLIAVSQGFTHLLFAV